MEKTCTKCLIAKPADNFYANATTCKPCYCARVKAHRAANIERIREYDRTRGGVAQRRAARRAYAQTPAGRAAHRRAHEKWEATNKHKRKANGLLNNAVKAGRLVRGPCEVCGTREDVEGHHDDYTKPLVVRWLCDTHHKAHHRAMRAQERELKRALDAKKPAR